MNAVAIGLIFTVSIMLIVIIISCVKCTNKKVKNISMEKKDKRQKKRINMQNEMRNLYREALEKERMEEGSQNLQPKKMPLKF